MLESVGPAVVIDYARRFGFTNPMQPYLSLALGAAEATPLEATSAYTVFPRQGVHMTPYQVLRVLDRQGNVLEENRPRAQDAIRADTAFVMTSLLQGVASRGTAAAAAALDWPVAGKTGTMDDYTDAWFIGFDPEITIGIWIGFDEKKTLGRGETGATAALPIWLDVMKARLELRGREPRPEFAAPGNIVFVTVDRHGRPVERRSHHQRDLHRRHTAAGGAVAIPDDSTDARPHALAPAWRRWLQKYHARKTDVWRLLQGAHRQARVWTSRRFEEALCFGWIDVHRMVDAFVVSMASRRGGRVSARGRSSHAMSACASGRSAWNAAHAFALALRAVFTWGGVTSGRSQKAIATRVSLVDPPLARRRRPGLGGQPRKASQVHLRPFAAGPARRESLDPDSSSIRCTWRRPAEAQRLFDGSHR